MELNAEVSTKPDLERIPHSPAFDRAFVARELSPTRLSPSSIT